MTEPEKLDVPKIINQANNLHDVVNWIDQTVANKQRLSRVEAGHDTEIFNIDRLREKNSQYMSNPRMTEYHHLIQLKEQENELDKEIKYHTTIIFGKTTPDDKKAESAIAMDPLNDKYKEIRSQYINSLKNIEPELFQTFPRIYHMIIDGTDIVTVRNVLRTYEKMQEGKIDAAKAIDIGIEYETARGAPTGIFDHLRVKKKHTKKKKH